MKSERLIQTAVCPECGIALSSGILGGLCPRCLFINNVEDILRRESPTRNNRFFGDYELLDQIARGGMGVIYRARQVSLGRLVAVKMILYGQFATQESIKRFRTESAAIARLQHPNIVSIHEFGEVDDQPFFSMDYIEGKNLAELAHEQPLTAERAARYVSAIAQAIHFAHERGIIHRDLKPSNVLIDSSDQPRVTDFGLAKQIDGKSDLTLSGHPLGSPSFMPPEQAAFSKSAVGPASDVYSIGAILYYLLTGRPPFVAETLHETLHQIVSIPPVRVTLLNPSVSLDLNTICLKCLEKEPTRRYASAKEVAEDLNRFLRGEVILARPVGKAERALRWCKRSPRTALATGLAVAGLIAGTSLLTWQWLSAQNANARLTSALEKMEVQRAEEFFRSEEAATGIAHLAKVVRKNQHNQAAATRLISAINMRPFALPAVPPLRHEDTVYSARFSPDGRYIVTASGDKTVRIWSSSTGEFAVPPLQHPAAVGGAEFSPDGEFILTACRDNVARLWETRTGKFAGKSFFHATNNLHQNALGRILVARFSSSDESIVTASTDGTARIWSSESGKQLGQSLVHKGAVYDAKFSPDRKTVATASADGSARLWDASSGQPRSEPLRHGGDVVEVNFSPDGKWIITASLAGTALIWNVQTGERRQEVLQHSRGVRHAEFSPNGKRIVTTSIDSTARIWDAETGAPVATTMRHESTIRVSSFSSDGKRLITASDDHTARIWDAETGKPLTEPMHHGGYVLDAQFSPNGSNFLTASIDGTARLWNPPRPSQTRILKHRDMVYSARFSHDGRRVVTASWDSTALIWDSRSGAPLTPPLKHSAGVRFADFSPDGRLVVTACYAGTAHLWDSVSGVELCSPLRHDMEVYSASFSPDGKSVVTASYDGTARIWDTASGKLKVPPLKHDAEVQYASFSPNGKLVATASHDFTARIWDANTGELKLAPLKHAGWVRYQQFSVDGAILLTASWDGSVRLWEVATGRLLPQEMKHNVGVNMAVLNGDDTKVATALRNNTAWLWNTSTRQPLLEPLKHSGSLKSVHFSPDGNFLVSASDDGTARVWSVSLGLPASEPLKHEGIVNYAEFSPDGRHIVTAAFDGTARIWDINVPAAPISQLISELAETIGGLRFLREGFLEVVSPNEVSRLQALLKNSAIDPFTRWEDTDTFISIGP